MGLDDFDLTEDEQDEPIAADDANASIDLDEDLFDFPMPEGERLSAEEELANAIEAVEEIAASMLPELDGAGAGTPSESTEPEEPQLVVPEEVLAGDVTPEPVDSEPLPEATANKTAPVETEPQTTTSAIDFDEDLFGFEAVDSTPPARTNDLEENLEEVFGIGADEPIGLDDAIGELLDAEDDLARQQTAAPEKEPKPAPSPQPTPAPEAAAAPAKSEEPVTKTKTIEPTPAPVAANATDSETPELFEDDGTGPGAAQRATAFAKVAYSNLRGRFSGAPILWLIGLMVSTNLLMLVIFWSSLGDVRDLVVETVHKVASAPAPTVLQRGAPLRQTLEGSAPIVQAADPDEETLTAQDTLATSQELITSGEFVRARTGLFRLLARIDAVSPDQRKSIEAEANHLIGETYRGQADALAARVESLGERR